MKLLARRQVLSVLLLFSSLEFIGTQSEMKSETKKALLKKNAKLKKFEPITATTTATPSTTTTATTTQTTTTTTEAPEPMPDNDRARLKKMLLKDYDKKIHPVKDWTKPVKVDVGMAVIHLDLDERRSVLDIDSWMRFNWTDQYLTWNPKLYAGVDQIHLGGEEIWKPDIHLYNNADGSNMNHFGDVYLLVYSNGNVLWVPPAQFQAFCKVDLKLWPHESPSCKLKFGSWTSHGDQISLGLFNGQKKVEHLNFYTENKEWIVLNTSVATNTNKYPSVSESYPDVTFTFNLQRNSPSYRAAIILPCLITMLVVVASFLLPPNAGEKLLVNSSCLIVCVLYLLHFQNVLPAMSDHIPLIVLFYSNTASLVGIAIVLNICCISLTREKRYSAPPKWLRNFFSGFIGRILCLGNYYHQVSETHERLVVELDDIQDSPECEQTERDLSSHGQAGSAIMKDWILVAAGIERFFFFIYTLAFAFVSGFYV